ncbi:MAG: hypothetical protein ABI947_07360 [Chloroflexota bacterium]
MSRKSINRWKFIVMFVGVFAAVGLASGLQLQAQSSSDTPIVLNDQSPSIDAVIKPDKGASGAISIELQNVLIRLTNDKDVLTFSAADPRITMISIQLAEGASAQTLHVERLPGVQVAQVKLSAQTTLPDTTVSPAQAPISTLNEPVMAKMILDPALSLPVTTTNANNMVRVEFSQGQQTVQLVDTKGAVLFNATTGSQINGLALRVSPGEYSLNVANDDKSAKAEMLVALGSTTPTTLTDQSVQPTAVPVVDNSSPSVACTASVHVNAATLRSGPGTGYTTTGFVTQNNLVAVGGLNREHNWTLVQSGDTSAWVPTSAIALSGNCTTLTVYDIPTRDLSLQVPSVAKPSAPAAPVGAVSGQPSSGGVDHEKHDSEDKNEHQKSQGEKGDD